MNKNTVKPAADRPVPVFDWSGSDGSLPATVGELAPGRPALLRPPGSRVPCHKVCAERSAVRKGGAR